jgi:hypothetical protein
MKLWQSLYGLSTSNLVDIVADFVEAVESFCSSTPHKILFNYLVHSATLESLPYRFTETQATIPFEFAPSSALEHDLEQALADVIFSISADRWDADDHTMEGFNVVIRRLCFFWRPLEPRPIPLAVICYLNKRKSESAINHILHSYDFRPRLIAAFPITLSNQSSTVEDARDQVLTGPLIIPLEARSRKSPIPQFLADRFRRNFADIWPTRTWPKLPKRVIFGSHGPKCQFFIPNSVFAALATDLRNWGTFLHQNSPLKCIFTSKTLTDQPVSPSFLAELDLGFGAPGAKFWPTRTLVSK